MVAYFDCFSGISGDMIIGALLDAGLDFESLRAELAKLNLPDDDIKLRRSKALQQTFVDLGHRGLFFFSTSMTVAEQTTRKTKVAARLIQTLTSAWP